MAEELRGQLSEAIPDAVAVFAEAITGGDAAKLGEMMQNGEVSAKELVKVMAVLQRKANAGGAYELALMGSQVKQGQFKAKWREFIELMSGGSGRGFDRTIGEFFRKLTQAMDTLVASASDVAKVLDQLAGAAISVGIAIKVLYQGFVSLNPALQAAVVSIGLIATGFGRIITFGIGLVSVILILEDFKSNIESIGDSFSKLFEGGALTNTDWFNIAAGVTAAAVALKALAVGIAAVTAAPFIIPAAFLGLAGYGGMKIGSGIQESYASKGRVELTAEQRARYEAASKAGLLNNSQVQPPSSVAGYGVMKQPVKQEINMPLNLTVQAQDVTGFDSYLKQEFPSIFQNLISQELVNFPDK